MPSSGDPLSLGGSLPMESPSDGEILKKHKENLLILNHGMKTCLCPMPYNLCHKSVLKKKMWEYNESYNSINYKLYPPFNSTHESNLLRTMAFSSWQTTIFIPHPVLMRHVSPGKKQEEDDLILSCFQGALSDLMWPTKRSWLGHESITYSLPF